MVFIVISLLGYYLYQTLIYHLKAPAHKDESFGTKIITLEPCIEKLQ